MSTAASFQIFRDLKGLRVQVVHPPDGEGMNLVEHLRRIGCSVEAQWPVPDGFSPTTDVVILAVEHEHRDAIRRMLKTREGIPPTVIAIVAYENPSILQIVLECRAQAVVERPIRPFGLLTNLVIARSLWLDRRDADRRIQKLERKLSGLQKIQKAKAILMTTKGLSEEEAYATIRRQAMGKRVPMEEMATAIIDANELLNFPPKPA